MAETSSTPPQTILAGRYVLSEELGRGGMASVWRATDEVLDRPVAVKILHEHLAEDPMFRERFSTEALAAARLTHPNIVNVFDTGAENGLSFIVMELFEGRTLARLLEERGPLDPERAIAIMLPVLAALQFAHDNGVVHRDIKPGNILVSDSGMVKVVDLGIARAAYSASDVATTGRVLGSVPYLSPEQVQGSEVDARSDVYACGVVLYEMLTGRRPFHAQTELAAAMMRLTRDPLPPRALRPGIPRALEAVVQRAMSRRPQDRFPSAENMAASLIRVQPPPPNTTGFPVVTPAPTHERPSEPAPAGPSFFQSWMLVPLVAILLAGVAIVIGLVLGKLQVGGPLGIETKNGSKGGPSPAATAAYHVANIRAFDPFGDNQEHDELIPNLEDNDPNTVWETSNYNDLNMAPKPGVGVLFDLGSPRPVGGFVMQTPQADTGWSFQVRVGDDPMTLASSPGPTTYVATSRMRESFSQPVTGRYVLLWITMVRPGVEGGNRAAVGLFQILGPAG
jgi:serine/threonine-protein kinase